MKIIVPKNNNPMHVTTKLNLKYLSPKKLTNPPAIIMKKATVQDHTLMNRMKILTVAIGQPMFEFKIIS